MLLFIEPAMADSPRETDDPQPHEAVSGEASMTPAKFLELINKLRNVSELHDQQQVTRLLPFKLRRFYDPKLNPNVLLIDDEFVEWLSFQYVIERPDKPASDDDYFVLLLINDSHLCVNRNDILAALGPSDPQPNPGYPADLTDEVLDRLLDPHAFDPAKRPERPYVMTYSLSKSPPHPLEFVFDTGHCLARVTIGVDRSPHLAFPIFKINKEPP